MSKAIQKFVVSDTDPRGFIEKVLSWGAKGAWLPDDEFPQMGHVAKHVKLNIEISDKKDILKNEPGITAFGAVYDMNSFTKSELEELDWDELRELSKSAGVFNRNRDQLIRQWGDKLGFAEEPKKAVKAEDKASEKEVVEEDKPAAKKPGRKKAEDKQESVDGEE